MRDAIFESLGESEICVELRGDIAKTRESMDRYQNLSDSFNIAIDPDVVEKFKTVTQEAALTYATGQAVYILKTTGNKVEKRKRLNDELAILDSVGTSEAALEGHIQDQVKKARIA